MSEALYRSMVADGDDPDAPRRVRVEHRGDRALVTLDEPDRLNVLSAPLVVSCAWRWRIWWPTTTFVPWC